MNSLTLVVRARLELATPALSAQCSNQLSYPTEYYLALFCAHVKMFTERGLYSPQRLRLA